MLDPSILHAQDFIGLRYVVLPVIVVPFAILCMVCFSLLVYALLRVIFLCLRCIVRTSHGLDGLLSRTFTILILYSIFALSINYNIYLIHQAKYQYQKTNCIIYDVKSIEQAGLYRYSATVIYSTPSGLRVNATAMSDWLESQPYTQDQLDTLSGNITYVYYDPRNLDDPVFDIFNPPGVYFGTLTVLVALVGLTMYISTKSLSRDWQNYQTRRATALRNSLIRRANYRTFTFAKQGSIDDVHILV